MNMQGRGVTMQVRVMTMHGEGNGHAWYGEGHECRVMTMHDQGYDHARQGPVHGEGEGHEGEAWPDSSSLGSNLVSFRSFR